MPMTNEKRVNLTVRDEQIVARVAEYRFLTTELLFALFREEGSPEKKQGRDGKERPKHYGFGHDALRKRLYRLANAGYLQRFRYTDIPAIRGYGSSPSIFGIDISAISLLASDDTRLRSFLRQQVRANSDLRSHALRHDVLRSKLHVALERSCMDGRVRLEWTQGKENRILVPNPWSGPAVVGILPDAQFTLTQGSRRLTFCLEVDMSSANINPRTLNRTSIRKKAELYLAIKNDPELRSQHHLDKFQVIFLTRQKERETSIRREDAMMLLARMLLSSDHSDFFLWLNEADIPLEEPKKLLSDYLFSCAYSTEHYHSLFPHMIQ